MNITKKLSDFGPEIKGVIVKIDETEYWREDIQEKAKGKIFGLYLIDLTMPTHCCELATSYPTHFIQNHFENVDSWKDANGEWIDDAQEITDLERGNSDDQEVRYYREDSSFHILEEIKETDFPSDDHEEWIESIIEYYLCNAIL